MNNNHKPYGYERNEQGVGYSINPKEAAVIRQQVASYTRVGSQEQLRDQKAALYARSATGENAALATQIDQCKEYAAEHGQAIDDQHVYQEIAPGSVDPRQHEQFSGLSEAAKRHEFAVLLVTNLDRLSRNSSAVMKVVRQLQKLGIAVIEAHQ